MFWTLKSSSPFSAPRDDTARAGCGNGAKSEFLSFHLRMMLGLGSSAACSGASGASSRAVRSVVMRHVCFMVERSSGAVCLEKGENTVVEVEGRRLRNLPEGA